MKGEDKRISYRVQDFVEVHKTDGNRDGLEEDRCECNEPQTLERNWNGHITAWVRHPNKFRAAGKHFQQGGQVRSSSAAFQLRWEREKGREGRETEQQFVGRWSRERERRGEEEYNSLNMSLLLDRNELEARCCKRNSMTPSRACRKCGNPNKG